MIQVASLAHLPALTAHTHGAASRLREQLNIEVVLPEGGGEAEQKADFVRRLGAEQSIALGNGSSDLLMLKASAVGICVIGKEGTSASALPAADVVSIDIHDALDLLLNPQCLIATLRS